MVTRAINNQDLIQDLILGSSRNVVTSEAHEPSELTKTYSSGGGGGGRGTPEVPRMGSSIKTPVSQRLE